MREELSQPRNDGGKEARHGLGNATDKAVHGTCLATETAPRALQP